VADHRPPPPASAVPGHPLPPGRVGGPPWPHLQHQDRHSENRSHKQLGNGERVLHHKRRRCVLPPLPCGLPKHDLQPRHARIRTLRPILARHEEERGVRVPRRPPHRGALARAHLRGENLGERALPQVETWENREGVFHGGHDAVAEGGCVQHGAEDGCREEVLRRNRGDRGGRSADLFGGVQRVHAAVGGVRRRGRGAVAEAVRFRRA